MQNLISIIIPTYNRSDFLGETLDSILKQTYKNWECIVVDDGSTDFTRELLELYKNKDKRFQYHLRPDSKPKGANACRNYGFEKSSGDLVNWFDSDDLMFSNSFLEEAVKEFQSGSAIDFVLTDFEIFSDSDKRVFHIQDNYINDILLDYVTGRINFGCPCVIWKKESLGSFKYNENLKRAQELDFHFRVLSRRPLNFTHIPGSKLHFRRHEISLTSNFQKGELSSLKAELRIRLNILNFLISKQYNKQDVLLAFEIYLRTFRKLVKIHPVKETLIELKSLERQVPFKNKYRKWKIDFFFLVILYKLTGREHKLKLHIKEIRSVLNA